MTDKSDSERSISAMPNIGGITYNCKVLDRVTKRPIKGAEVTVRRWLASAGVPFSNKLGETKHVTDAEGRYEFTLPAEEADNEALNIEVIAEQANYLRRWYWELFHTIRSDEGLGKDRFSN